MAEPPNESCNILVSLDSRYGIILFVFFSETNLKILPKEVKLLFMKFASASCFLLLFDCLSSKRGSNYLERSEPAKSTKLIRPVFPSVLSIFIL